MADLEKAEIVGTPAMEGTYISEMDMWPLECEESNRIHPFYDNLREGRFTTTKCKVCGHTAFPPGVILLRNLPGMLSARLHLHYDGQYLLRWPGRYPAGYFLTMCLTDGLLFPGWYLPDARPQLL